MYIDNFNTDKLDIFADPISHSELDFDGESLITPSKFIYHHGDFRIALSGFLGNNWVQGQVKYEAFNNKFMSNSLDFFKSVDLETSEIYMQIPLVGRVLDVGGGYGTAALQANVPHENFIVIDPMICKWDSIKSKSFLIHYKALENLIRVPGFAEALPFKNATFDTVHMRSCIDHFENPHRALLESRRVLNDDGKLVIGISLEGSYKISDSKILNFGKLLFKGSIFGKLYERFIDPHMFHPTLKSLEVLTKNAGFEIVKVINQKGYSNVVYLEAIKSSNPIAE
jgi:ubiquinone/menaquinone biosynthesis C-methylase UbiE